MSGLSLKLFSKKSTKFKYGRPKRHKHAKNKTYRFNSDSLPIQHRLPQVTPHAQRELTDIDYKLLQPPKPPPQLDPLVALNPQTETKILWTIARTRPDLRKWLIANPSSEPQLLEFVSQAGGIGVKKGFEILFSQNS